MKKTLNIVLHTHIPYVLSSHDVEYWLCEVVLNSYLPLLDLFEKHKPLPFCITINLSPILLVQLNSPEFKITFQNYINCKKEILSFDTKDKKKNRVLQKDLETLIYLEQLYTNWSENIITAFQYYSFLGKLNIITSSVTHAYLPSLISFPNLLNLQIKLGKQISDCFFPNTTGFWSPECGIFPELSSYLGDNSINYTFSHRNSFYSDTLENVFQYENIFYLCNHIKLTSKIWDANIGYPGNCYYREFHREISSEYPQIKNILQKYNIPLSGISLYSITDKTKEYKNIYNSDQAFEQLQYDTNDFIDTLQQELNNTEFISIFFDTELFGHWWKEGVDFLLLLIPKILEQNISISHEFPTQNIHHLAPNVSSWGVNNNAESWINNNTKSIWEELIFAYNHLEYRISNHNPIQVSEYYYHFLSQASDWTFLITQNSFVSFSKDMITKLLQYSKNNKKIYNKNLLFQIISNNI